jgi:type VI secretion system protein VasG
MKLEARHVIYKLDATCLRAVEQAAIDAANMSHASVGIEHVLAALLAQRAAELQRILEQHRIVPAQLSAQLNASLDRLPRGHEGNLALAPELVPWIQDAWLFASIERGQTQIGAGALLLALLTGDPHRGLAVSSAPALAGIATAELRDQLAATAETRQGGAEPWPAPAPAQSPATPALARYTTDLTALARSGGIDPVSGRDAEVRQIIDILMRRRQNNPILTGEAGVGKTAVVEGFAARVAAGDVPPALAGVAVLALDLGLLQAGAGVKGEFEERLKSVIAEVRAAARSVILFIDEAHQLIGAGGAEGQGDAANLLKPALARGELRTIAATTWGEYKKYVEKDAALARRFQLIKVDEPSEEAAIAMLRGLVGNLERHHGVTILDAAVRESVLLSQRYISARKLPDKAISVLDTACARVAIGQSSTPLELETLSRDIARIDAELRVLGMEALAGADYAGRIGDLSRQLELLRASERELLPRLEQERRAVDAILAVRARLREAAEAGIDEDDSDVSVAHLSQELARLEQGLVAIQDDQPMVPVCVDARMVAGVVAAWTGIPVGKMLTDDVHTVLHLKERIAQRVVGQDPALDAIARRIRTFRAELDDPDKPVGVFLLVGPSGVGKTETAAALADLLYGGERNMIVVNMSEFQEAHTVSNIKGAPPGYVGYGQGGVLTEAVRRKPYSVVLLDEVEKAHADVIELFYNVFDKGTMEDGQGLTVDFRNTVILLTSNAAQEVLGNACQDGAMPDSEQLVELLRPALLAYFKPAFLGRMVIVPYRPLGEAQLAAIVKLKLDRIKQRFETNHQAALAYDAALPVHVAALCTDAGSGARNIDHILTHALLPELSARVLEKRALARSFSRVQVGIAPAGGFSFVFSDDAPGAPLPRTGLVNRVLARLTERRA